MKQLQKMNMYELEKEMLVLFKNIVRNSKADYDVSVTENQHFLELFTEWVFKSHRIDSKDIQVNFKLDKNLEDVKAKVNKINDKCFNVFVDRKYLKATSAKNFAYGLFYSAHEIRHIVQSVKCPSWEQDMARQRTEVASLLEKCLQRAEAKKLKKIITRFGENAEQNHFAELDADVTAYNYVTMLIDNLGAVDKDNSVTDYLQTIKKTVTQINKDEFKKAQKKNYEIYEDIKLAQQYGIDLDSLLN